MGCIGDTHTCQKCGRDIHGESGCGAFLLGLVMLLWAMLFVAAQLHRIEVALHMAQPDWLSWIK